MKDYMNSEARGGKPSAQGKHDASMNKVEAGTKHLTSPSGGAKSIGDQGPREKTKDMKNDMGPVKKVAGGSNY